MTKREPTTRPMPRESLAETAAYWRRQFAQNGLVQCDPCCECMGQGHARK